MRRNPKLGNRIILLGGAIVFAIASFFVQWGTIQVTEDDVRDSMTINGQNIGMDGTDEVGDVLSEMISSTMTGMAIPLTGQTGSVTLGPINLPFWLAIVAVVFGLIVTITNTTGVSDVPRVMIRGLLVFGVVISLWAVVVMLFHGSIGLGAALLIGSATTGLIGQQNHRHDDESDQI